MGIILFSKLKMVVRKYGLLTPSKGGKMGAKSAKKVTKKSLGKAFKKITAREVEFIKEIFKKQECVKGQFWNNKKIVKYLGSGADGVVYKLCDANLCTALKEVPYINADGMLGVDKNDFNMIEEATYFYIVKEIAAKNPHLPGLSHVNGEFIDTSICYANNNKYRYIEMGLFDGDVLDLYEKCRLCLSKDVMLSLVLQISQAIKDLNSVGIIHNDLHVGNVLYRKLRNKVKISYDILNNGNPISIETNYIFYINDFSRSKFFKEKCYSFVDFEKFNRSVKTLGGFGIETVGITKDYAQQMLPIWKEEYKRNIESLKRSGFLEPFTWLKQ